MRWNGRLYEWWSAWREHRAAADLYHCGLMLCLDDIRYAVEMGPVWNVTDADRGVIAEGPVGSRWLGRFRAFRYEMRCWPGGRIPDVAEAVDSPVRTTQDPTRVAAVLDVLREIPVLTWGRDELGAARCGTPTLRWPGRWRARTTTWTRSGRLREAARRVGTRVSCSRIDRREP